MDDDDDETMLTVDDDVEGFPEAELSVGTAERRGCRALKRWDKVLLVALLVLLVALICCVATLVVQNEPPATEKPKEVGICTTRECVRIASRVFDSLDLSADPCADFYSYACGGWGAMNPLPNGQASWDSMGMLRRENTKRLEEVLQTKEKKESQSEYKAQWFYETCIDNDAIEAAGAQPLVDVIQKLGGWNITGVWNGTASIQNLLQNVTKNFTLGCFFELNVDDNPFDSSRISLQLDIPKLPLPSRDNYISTTDENVKIQEAYLEYMQELALLLGGEEKAARRAVRDVLEFEKQLALISVPVNVTKAVTIAELQKLSPFLDWMAYMKAVFQPFFMTEGDTVVVFSESYLRNITALYQRTPLEVLNNYVVWRVVQRLVPNLGSSFETVANKLKDVIFGTEMGGFVPRSQMCVAETDRIIGMGLGDLYVKRYFDVQQKIQVERMIESTRTAFNDNLETLSWMDNVTRHAALKKSNSMTDQVGYPHDVLDIPAILDSVYIELKLVNDSYFKNVLSSLLYDVSLWKNLLIHGRKTNTWRLTPPTVNAYYVNTENAMVFPAGILQAPFYDKDAPMFTNYGSIGTLMGRELTHAFDNRGSHFNYEGNLKEWWEADTRTRFEEKADCLVQQYGAMEEQGQRVDGRRTLDENIADNGGLHVAFRAYEKWVYINGIERSLPAMNLTNEQLFFIAFAQTWCSVQTPQALEESVVTDAHSPPRLRVNGALSNSAEFARHFQCKPGSAMNPEKKCQIW